MTSSWRRVALLAVVALVVLGVAEGGTRLLGPFLTQPLSWPDRTTQTKVAQMEAAGCADVVFVGNSMARDGLVPAVFTQVDPAGRRAYNASLDAATPDHLAPWVADQVVPTLDPEVVVLALASFDLNRHNQAGTSAAEAYRASRGGRTDRFAEWEEAVADHVALVRYRTQLRQPTELWDGIGRAVAGERQPRDDAQGIEGLIGPDGEGLSRADLEFTGPTATTRFLTEDLIGDFELSAGQVESAATLVEGLADDGVEVVLLVMPVTDDFVDLHPHGRADIDAFRAAVDRLGADTGAPVVDLLQEPFPDDEFADTHHLNAAGAEHLTRVVATQLPEGSTQCG